jgi:hypothetical protein
MKANLDLVQDVFVKLANRNGISLEEMSSDFNEEKQNLDWSIDYSKSLQLQIDTALKKMMECFQLQQTAAEAGDEMTEYKALIRAAIFARTLASMFSDIDAECSKVLLEDKRFVWPKNPENI